jgi:hypothetical protein
MSNLLLPPRGCFRVCYLVYTSCWGGGGGGGVFKPSNRRRGVFNRIYNIRTLSPITTKYVYIKSTTVYVPSSELGLSQPLYRQRMCPSPQNRGWGVGGVPIPTTGERGHTRLRVRGWGSPNSDDWRKSLALCLLCAYHSHGSWRIYPCLNL